MKKWIKSFFICFILFLPLIALDIYSFNFGLQSYSNIFQSDLKSLITFNWAELGTYAFAYLIIYFLFCLYFSYVSANYKNIFFQLRLYVLTFLSILIYSALIFPQIFYPLRNFDYLISTLPSWTLILLYFGIVLSTIYFHLKSAQKKYFSTGLLCVYFLIQMSQLFNVRLHLNTPKVIKESPLIVVSLDSIRSDSYDDIKKYAKGTLKDYLSQTTLADNVIADNTQTRESFHSLFTGNHSFQLKNRYPFSDTFEPSKQNELHFLKELQNQSYRTIFIRDEQETVQLSPGLAIDDVITTSPIEKLSILMNKISHSFVVFQIWPHFISEKIMPSAYNTSTQALGYKPIQIAQSMTDSVASAAVQSESLQRKSFFFIHSCISHTPVKLPYPYNTDLTPPKDMFESFSYSDFKNYPNIIDIDHAVKRHSYDRQYYSRMIQYVTEQYLNPLFDNLQQAGAYDPTKIILMSDHGENFWNDRKFLPIRKNFPFHGDTDLFGTSADKPLFVSFKKLNDSKILNLSQALGFIINEKKPSHLVYTENSFSLSEETKDFLFLIDYSLFVKNYNKMKNSNFVSVNPDFEMATALYLQKSFYENNLKISFYRTPTGRKVFVCDIKADNECVNNLWITQKDNRQKWINTYNQMLISDIQLNKEVPVQLNKQSDIDPFDEMKQAKQSTNLWLNLYAALLKMTLINNSDELLALKNKLAGQELLLHAYEKVTNRYLQKPGTDFVQTIATYDRWDSINQLIMNNRIEKFVSQKANIKSDVNGIHHQLSSISDSHKKDLFIEIQQELDRTFKYGLAYKLPYQTEAYWTLLFKFATDLDQVQIAKSEYLLQKDNVDVRLHFRQTIEKYINSESN